MRKWNTFYLDTNSVWGIMDSREKWEEAKAIWTQHGRREPEELKDCPGMPPESQEDRSIPKFGYVVECSGPDTLREFFERHGMEW